MYRWKEGEEEEDFELLHQSQPQLQSGETVAMAACYIRPFGQNLELSM